MTDAPQLVPLKHVTRHNDETLPETTNPETPINYIEISDVQSQIGIVNSTSLTFGDAPSRARRIIRTGDLLVSTVRTYLRAIASAGEAHDGYIASTGFCVLRANKILPSYLKYAASSPDFVEAVVANSTGVSYPAINASDLVRLPIPVPDQPTQHRITAFLDHETAHIDALIAKQERLIELLAEKSQAVITQAVTKGLDSTAPTKPSDIPWVGQVPANWSLPKLKQCCRLKRGRFMHRPRNAPHLYGGKYPFIQTGSIARAEGKYITTYSQTLSDAGMETSALLPQGCLVMAIAANVGDVAILSFDSCAPDSVVGFYPMNHATLDFLYYALAARRDELIREAPVTSQGNLNVERVGSLTIPLPSLKEQRAIVQVLDRELERIQQLKTLAAKAILLLKERRSALISAAVSGKIDVREGAA